MNEDKLLKALKAATSVEVSSRTDDAVLNAAREKAAQMRAAKSIAPRRRLCHLPRRRALEVQQRKIPTPLHRHQGPRHRGD
jgi:hypothetical protein